jgi:hypothetical protein
MFDKEYVMGNADVTPLASLHVLHAASSNVTDSGGKHRERRRGASI